MTARKRVPGFSYRMVPEVYQVFWAGMAAVGDLAGQLVSQSTRPAGRPTPLPLISVGVEAVGGTDTRRFLDSRA